MTFYETRFPADIAGGAQGGPMRVTDIVTLRSGFEETNSIWQHSRRRWDAAYGIKTANDLHAVLEFWEAMGGRQHQFRWKDHADFRSCAPLTAIAATDQGIGTGDDSTTDFQLVKAYAAGAASYSRPIRKPVAGSVLVAIDGTPQGSGWVVDTTTGIVSFSVAPSIGEAITAGFEFDVPARFNNDHLPTQLELYHGGEATIEIMEVRV